MVKFEVTKTGTTQKVEGEFMPMVANDGPHYGDNIKLFGPGKYHVKFKPFDVEYDFSFVGIGKKGGY